MTENPLPLPLHQLTAVLVFALGVFLVAMHSILIGLGARRAALGLRTQILAPSVAAGLLALWFGIALTADASAVPLSRLQFLVVAFAPVLAGVVLLLASRTVRALNAAMPAAWLIRVQSYRMAGLIFLFPFLAYGLVPAGFAVPAAVGDFLTGLAAPLVAAAVERRAPRSLGWATAWNLFGILDLIVAPVAGILTRAQVLALHPLALVPLFIGPPLGILTHIYSLRNLARAARAEAGSSRAEPGSDPDWIAPAFGRPATGR